VDKAGLDPEEAARQIKAADEDIARWTALLFSKSPWDASLYDVKIPVPATSLDDAATMICENAAKEPLAATEQSLQAAVDFGLATRVNLALLDHGQFSCDVTASGNKVTVVINKKLEAKGAFVKAIRTMRYETADEKVRQVALGVEGVEDVETRPGKDFGRGSRALLVDDEEEYVATLSQRLQMRDIESDVVHDGEQALSAVGAEEPDVMVLDLRMPGIDGMEVLRRTKRDHPNVEVIIVTGHGTDKDEAAAKALGAFKYLTKPVDIDVLAEAMRDASRKANEPDDVSQPSVEAVSPKKKGE
jgi:CheY-like chemotaxis protein